MDGPVSEVKYQKLASEYAKLRAQASVLKKAVLEEQSKCAHLRDQLRQRDTVIRRAEQEVDSLGFRNKQLEHRVAVLQEEIASREGRKREKDQKRGGGGNGKDDRRTPMADNGDSELAQDAIIFEELQKKIMENAQLTSLIDDKERDLQLHTERIASLEQALEKRNAEHCDLEQRLRRDLETAQHRKSELETKLVEAASMLGSEDALSVSGSDNTPIHSSHHHHHSQPANSYAATTTTTAAAHLQDERIALEKEVLYWRTQYEISKLNETFANSTGQAKEQAPPHVGVATAANCMTSTAAAGLVVKASYTESKSAQRDSLKDPPPPPTKEQLMYNTFSKKYEELLRSRYMAEARVSSYETEAEHLQNCLENATHELKAKDEQMDSINQALQMLEEDLATTRINYEEQISVMTEQVISLSEQLAACK